MFSVIAAIQVVSRDSEEIIQVSLSFHKPRHFPPRQHVLMLSGRKVGPETFQSGPVLPVCGAPDCQESVRKSSLECS